MDPYLLLCSILRSLQIALKFGKLATSHKGSCEKLVAILTALEALIEKILTTLEALIERVQHVDMVDSEEALKQLEAAVLKAKKLLCECQSRSRIYMILKGDSWIPRFSEIADELEIGLKAIGDACSRYKAEVSLISPFCRYKAEVEALCAEVRGLSFKVPEADRKLSASISAVLRLQQENLHVNSTQLLELAQALELDDDSAVEDEKGRLEEDMVDARADSNQQEVQSVLELLKMVANIKAAKAGESASPSREVTSEFVEPGSVDGSVPRVPPQLESRVLVGTAAEAIASSDGSLCESPVLGRVGGEGTSFRTEGYTDLAVDPRNSLLLGMPIPPQSFLCPLSQDVMIDPVSVSTGVTYERARIQQHLDEGYRTCPATGERLMHTNLIPNSTLKGKIKNWCDEHQLLPAQPGLSVLTSPGAEARVQGLPRMRDSSLEAWATASSRSITRDDDLASPAPNLQSQSSDSFFPPLFRPPDRIGLPKVAGSPGSATDRARTVMPDSQMHQLSLDEGREGPSLNGWAPVRARLPAEEGLPAGGLMLDVPPREGSNVNTWGVIQPMALDDDSSSVTSPTSTASSLSPSPQATSLQARTFPVNPALPQTASTGGTGTSFRVTPSPSPGLRVGQGQSRRTIRSTIYQGEESGRGRLREDQRVADDRVRISPGEGGSARNMPWETVPDRGGGLQTGRYMHGFVEKGSRSPGYSLHTEPRPHARTQSEAQTPDASRRWSSEEPRGNHSAKSRLPERGDRHLGRGTVMSPGEGELSSMRGSSEHPMAPGNDDSSRDSGSGPFTDPYLGEYAGECDFAPPEPITRRASEAQVLRRDEHQESRRSNWESNHVPSVNRQLSTMSVGSISSSLSLLNQGRGSDIEPFGGVEVEKLVDLLYSNSVEEQFTAAAQLRLLSRSNNENRFLIATAGGIKPLVGLLGASEPALVEEAVTALLNLSIHEDNKTTIADAGAIDSLVHVLESGNLDARKNAAATLFSLSVVDEHKVMIGDSGAIPPLVRLLEDGSPRAKKDAATALFNLSIYKGNKKKIIRAGAVRELVALINDSTLGMVDKAVALLANLATIPEGQEVIGEEEGIPALVEVLELGTNKGKENAAAALLQLCKNSHEHLQMVLQEGVIPPLVGLSQSGTARARQKASELLTLFRGQKSSTRAP